MKNPDTLAWVEELLTPGYRRKPMFGGFTYSYDDVMVMALFESEGSRSYRGQTYPYELWFGCMFPVEREKQDEARAQFPFLVQHPVLGKWLYLPSETEDFESNAEAVLREIRRRNPLLGTIPNSKRPKKGRAVKEDAGTYSRTPMMFREELPAEKLKKARRLSDLLGLGPVMEKRMIQAGIRSVEHFVKMGWQEAAKRLVDLHPRHLNAIYAYVLIGALGNVGFNEISEAEKKEAVALMAQWRQEMKAAKKKATPKKKAAPRKAPSKTKISRAKKR